MGFDKFNAIKEAPSNKSQASFLKINKYEDPEMALGLISHICTSPKVVDIEPYFKPYHNIIKELYDKIQQHSNNTYEYQELFNQINKITQFCKDCLQNNIGNAIEIALVGGYSSGKSTMLNSILGMGELLPTGIQPVSIVNTYINCSSRNKNIIIRGENIKNDIVLLNTEVLDCIQHAAKSKVYIASVLNKLLISIPCKKQLNGITFIDTPGYNNSVNNNIENNTTDCHTAYNAIENADAIIWCIDIEAGTITDSDFKILSTITKPTIIVFTKMDKKAPSEVKKILQECIDVTQKKMGHKNPIIDYIAYSSRDNTSFSLQNKNILNIIESLKNKIVNSDFNEAGANLIKKSVQDTINAIDSKIQNLEKLRKEISEEKHYFSIINLQGSIKYNSIQYIDKILRKLESEYNDIIDKMNDERKIIQILQKYNNKLITSFQDSYKGADNAIQRHLKSLCEISNFSDGNIFTAIHSGNYKKFLSCISKGIDITKCNNEGYSPLTYAAKMGDNQIVKFFLSHDVDLTMKDKKGYNILETAVMYHYQDICQLIINKDKSLLRQSPTLVELAKKNNFIQWISNIK